MIYSSIETAFLSFFQEACAPRRWGTSTLVNTSSNLIPPEGLPPILTSTGIKGGTENTRIFSIRISLIHLLAFCFVFVCGTEPRPVFDKLTHVCVFVDTRWRQRIGSKGRMSKWYNSSEMRRAVNAREELNLAWVVSGPPPKKSSHV